MGYLPDYDFDTFDYMTCCDYGDVPIQNGSYEFSFASMRKGIGEILDAGCVPITFGGDHAISYPLISELCKPGRDVRDTLPPPLLRSDIMQLEDLKPGMVLQGTVRNVIDFGAFVDLGVHQDGLVHISQISDRFIKHPREVLKVGDIVKVKVLSVDVGKKRIALSMKGL